MAKQENAGLTLIEAVDEQTRQSFLRLLQKFTGLKAEIAAKQSMLDEYPSTDSKEKRSDLEVLANQLDQALANIEELFQTPLPEELTKEAFIEMTSKELETVKEDIDSQLHQLAELSEKI